MKNGRHVNGSKSGKSERDPSEIRLEAIQEELSLTNRLLILSLARSGIQLSDVASGGLQKSNSVLSKMFPKGLLKRVAQLSKEPSAVE